MESTVDNKHLRPAQHHLRAMDKGGDAEIRSLDLQSAMLRIEPSLKQKENNINASEESYWGHDHRSTVYKDM